MASHVQHVTRAVVTRRPGDIDPKVAGVFTVAAATIAIVVIAVIAVQVLGGHPDVTAVIGPILPVLTAAAVGYLKRSTHRELIEDGIEQATEIADALAPAIIAIAPAAADDVDQVVDGLTWVARQIDDDPTPAA